MLSPSTGSELAGYINIVWVAYYASHAKLSFAQRCPNSDVQYIRVSFGISGADIDCVSLHGLYDLF